MRTREIDAVRCNELLTYDPLTGIFRWKLNRGRVKAGDVAGCTKTALGYVILGIDGAIYRAHRVAFALMGFPVPQGVDHVDGCTSNNRWCNLRPCNQTENNWNAKPRKSATKTLKGVRFEARTGRWTAQCRSYGKVVHLGTFDTEQEAHAAYAASAALHFGEFARTT